MAKKTIARCIFESTANLQISAAFSGPDTCMGVTKYADVVRYNKNQHCPFIVFQNMFDTPIVHRYATHREVKTWMP